MFSHSAVNLARKAVGFAWIYRKSTWQRRTFITQRNSRVVPTPLSSSHLPQQALGISTVESKALLYLNACGADCVRYIQKFAKMAQFNWHACHVRVRVCVFGNRDSVTLITSQLRAFISFYDLVCTQDKVSHCSQHTQHKMIESLHRAFVISAEFSCEFVEPITSLWLINMEPTLSDHLAHAFLCACACVCVCDNTGSFTNSLLSHW